MNFFWVFHDDSLNVNNFGLMIYGISILNCTEI